MSTTGDKCGNSNVAQIRDVDPVLNRPSTLIHASLISCSDLPFVTFSKGSDGAVGGDNRAVRSVWLQIKGEGDVCFFKLVTAASLH